MSDFELYFNLGLQHVLDLNGYDHLLFLLALTVPFDTKEWKKLLLLLTLFTVGHTLSLFLSILNIVTVNASWIELLIPITILITALYNLINTAQNSKNQSFPFVLFSTLFFGLIHGLGFSNYFKTIAVGTPTDKVLPTLQFAVGIETAQIVIVTATLLLTYTITTLTKFTKRDWIICISAFIIGVVMPLILQNEIWSK
jgi:hydrogenase/urease accessory protein HupE